MQASVFTIDWDKEVLRARDLIASQAEQPSCEVQDHCERSHSALTEPLLTDPAENQYSAVREGSRNSVPGGIV